MRRGAMRSLVVAAVATVGMLTAAGAVAAATPQAVASDGPAGRQTLQTRPYSIFYTGDGSGFVAGSASTRSHLHWSSWGATGGSASGADWINDCTPDCADGHFHGYPATVRVYQPARIGGRLVFSRMTIAYTGRRPSYLHGKRSLTYRVGFTNRDYFWR